VKLSIMFANKCKPCRIHIDGCCWCNSNKNRKNCACVERDFFWQLQSGLPMLVLISSGRHIFNYQPDLLLSWKKNPLLLLLLLLLLHSLHLMKQIF